MKRETKLTVISFTVFLFCEYNTIKLINDYEFVIHNW